MSRRSARIEAFEAAMHAAGRCRAAGDPAAAFAWLERAHVLGQRDVARHLRVHLRMLRVACAAGRGREALGQVLRLALVPLGHLSGRLPIGNTGGANVNAFRPMAISPELARLLEDDPG